MEFTIEETRILRKALLKYIHSMEGIVQENANIARELFVKVDSYHENLLNKSTAE